MSDKGVDLIVYLLLTLGASAIGWFKASKEKKAKNTPPEFHLPEEEHDDLDDEIVVISQEPETHLRSLFLLRYQIAMNL